MENGECVCSCFYGVTLINDSWGPIHCHPSIHRMRASRYMCQRILKTQNQEDHTVGPKLDHVTPRAECTPYTLHSISRVLASTFLCGLDISGVQVSKQKQLLMGLSWGQVHITRSVSMPELLLYILYDPNFTKLS